MPEPGDIPLPEEAVEEVENQQNNSAEDPHRWSSRGYDAVEHTNNPGLQEFMKVEKEFILDEITNGKTKTFIDIGAGRGRMVDNLAKQAGRVINIERDDDMFSALSQKCAEFPNSIAVKADANRLEEALEGQAVENPVLFSFQNTLGTWYGDRDALLDSMRSLAESKKGEIIISLFCKEGLRDFGIGMYQSLFEQSNGELPTEPDEERTDFDGGIFRSTKEYGYESMVYKETKGSY